MWIEAYLAVLTTIALVVALWARRRREPWSRSFCIAIAGSSALGLASQLLRYIDIRGQLTEPEIVLVLLTLGNLSAMTALSTLWSVQAHKLLRDDAPLS